MNKAKSYFGLAKKPTQFVLNQPQEHQSSLDSTEVLTNIVYSLLQSGESVISEIPEAVSKNLQGLDIKNAQDLNQEVRNFIFSEQNQPIDGNILDCAIILLFTYEYLKCVSCLSSVETAQLARIYYILRYLIYQITLRDNANNAYNGPVEENGSKKLINIVLREGQKLTGVPKGWDYVRFGEKLESFKDKIQRLSKTGQIQEGRIPMGEQKAPLQDKPPSYEEINSPALPNPYMRTGPQSSNIYDFSQGGDFASSLVSWLKWAALIILVIVLIYSVHGPTRGFIDEWIEGGFFSAAAAKKNGAADSQSL